MRKRASARFFFMTFHWPRPRPMGSRSSAGLCTSSTVAATAGGIIGRCAAGTSIDRSHRWRLSRCCCCRSCPRWGDCRARAPGPQQTAGPCWPTPIDSAPATGRTWRMPRMRDMHGRRPLTSRRRTTDTALTTVRIARCSPAWRPCPCRREYGLRYARPTPCHGSGSLTSRSLFAPRPSVRAGLQRRKADDTAQP